MPKRLKVVVEQWVLFMLRRQTWQARRFRIFQSARHFRIESGRPIRIRIESQSFEGPCCLSACMCVCQSLCLSACLSTFT